MKHIKSKKLLPNEKLWLEAMFNRNFLGKEILIMQINSADVIREYNVGYISIKFKNIKTVQKFPYSIRVPIEMRVVGKNNVPAVFIIHIIDGFVDELEIFNADSSSVSKDIKIKDQEIIIDKLIQKN